MVRISDEGEQLTFHFDMKPIPRLKAAVLAAMRRELPAEDVDVDIGVATDVCFTLVAEAATLWYQLSRGEDEASPAFTFDNFAETARGAIESHAKARAS